MKFFFKNYNISVLKKNPFFYKIKKIVNFSSKYKKKNYWFFRSFNFKYLNTFLNISMRDGMKKKIKIYLSKIFYNFFYLISLENTIFNEFNNMLEITHYNFYFNKNYFFINYIFKMTTDLILSSYTLDFKKNLKKNKKQKTIYKAKTTYVFNKDRQNLAFRWLLVYSKNFANSQFFNRLFKSIFYTLIEGRDSFLFLKKIEVYTYLYNSQKKE